MNMNSNTEQGGVATEVTDEFVPDLTADGLL